MDKFERNMLAGLTGVFSTLLYAALIEYMTDINLISSNQIIALYMVPGWALLIVCVFIIPWWLYNAKLDP